MDQHFSLTLKEENKMAKIGLLKNLVSKDFPSGAIAHICVLEYAKDSEERVLLSPELMTHRQVDESVNSLIDQIEAARAAAKKYLKR